MKHYTLRSDIAENSFNKSTKYVKQCQYYTLYKNTFQQNQHHMETSQLICKANPLTGFPMIRAFTGMFFRTGNSNN